MVDAGDALQRGRESYATRAWIDAYECLSRADRAVRLGAEDLELLGGGAGDRPHDLASGLGDRSGSLGDRLDRRRRRLGDRRHGGLDGLADGNRGLGDRHRGGLDRVGDRRGGLGHGRGDPGEARIGGGGCGGGQ